MMTLAALESTFDLVTTLADGTKLFSWAVNTIMDNPLLAIVFTVGTLAPIGFRLFRKAKAAA